MGIFSFVRNRATVTGAVLIDIQFTRLGGHLERNWRNTDRREKGLERKLTHIPSPTPRCTPYVQTQRLN
jgi:hypothetical protein